jgi:hypothetical protein
MTLPELQACLDRLGVRVSACEDRLHYQAPKGVLTQEIKAALACHKTALLALLAGPPEAAPEPELPGCMRPELLMDSRGWRDSLGWWPIPWRQKWADRAEALQVEGKTWQEAEWQSFLETVDQINAAEAAGEVVEFTEPAPADDVAAIQAILAWPLDDRTSWAEMIESGRRHNEAVLFRPAAREQTPKTPASIPDSLQQLDLFK